jgi:NTP pyrophosphatase (non-canonical NTP hydrolase)
VRGELKRELGDVGRDVICVLGVRARQGQRRLRQG